MAVQKGVDVNEGGLAIVDQSFIQHLEAVTVVTLHVIQKSGTGAWKRTQFCTYLYGNAEQTTSIFGVLRDADWFFTDLLAITVVLIDVLRIRSSQEAERLDGRLVLLWNHLVCVAARATDFHIPHLQFC